MNAQALARDYLRKGKARRRALQVLFEEGSYDDVVREAQAIVELILKGALRFIGVDPPKRHDVGSTVVPTIGGLSRYFWTAFPFHRECLLENR